MLKNQEPKIMLARFCLPMACLVLGFNASLAAASFITFTDKSGVLVSDAEVVRTNAGVSLVWEKDGGASGGVVRLEDLPEDLQARFGYDPAKTAAADELEKQRRIQWQQSVLAAQAADLAQQRQMALNQNSLLEEATNSFPVYTSPRYTRPHRHRIIYVRPTRSHPTPLAKPPVNKPASGKPATPPKSSKPHP